MEVADGTEKGETFFPTAFASPNTEGGVWNPRWAVNPRLLKRIKQVLDAKPVPKRRMGKGTYFAPGHPLFEERRRR